MSDLVTRRCDPREATSDDVEDHGIRHDQSVELVLSHPRDPIALLWCSIARLSEPGAHHEVRHLEAGPSKPSRAKLHERVGGEWSLVDTQRHLLFASDAWLGNAVLEEQIPHHPLGLPAEPGFSADDTAKLGLTPDAAPTLDEVLAPRLARMAVMRRVVEGITDSELDRVCGRKPADPYPDQEYVVRRCLKVVLKEEAEHHRYTVRDLSALETATPGE